MYENSCHSEDRKDLLRFNNNKLHVVAEVDLHLNFPNKPIIELDMISLIVLVDPYMIRNLKKAYICKHGGRDGLL